jgi:cell wall-associated NlpC family hydrolase
MRRLPFALALVLALPAFGSAPAHLASLQARIVASAREHLRAPPRLPRNDCSGLVISVLAGAGIDHPGDSTSMWHAAVADGRAYDVGVPAPGHLVFFDRTWDSNKNGLVDDELTHVAIVVDVDDDGTVTMVHKERAGVRLLRLSLARPAQHKDGARVLNDFLRASHYGADDDPRLAGQLLRGFAAPPRS